ncbi:MAG TPA: acyltransferase [Pirellulales bacterium]|nr:acyltransferase [Pirellulales bacterium]
MTEPTNPQAALHAESGKIGDIQVLRGIAILMVLVCHLSIGAEMLGVWPVKVTMPLYLGVEIFFVVSGYVITRSLMKDEFHGGRFFVKRIFRLMPALLCFIGLTLILNRYVQQADLPDSGKTLFSVSNGEFRREARGVAFGYLTFLMPGRSFANAAMWSLSVEDQFYAGVTALCLVLGGLLRLSRRWTERTLMVAAAGLYVFLTGRRLAIWGAGPAATAAAVQYLVGWKFDFLALGVTSAFIDRRFAERVRIFFAQSGPYCSAFLLLLPIMLAAVCESPNAAASPVLHSVGYVLMGLSFAGLVLLAASGLAFPASRGSLYRACWFVGDRSYTYYLFHYPMFIVAWLLFHRFFPTAFKGPWHYAVAQGVTVAALLIPFSELVYRCVELPLADLGRRIAARMKHSNAGATSAAHASPVHGPTEFYEAGGDEANRPQAATFPATDPAAGRRAA